MSPSAGQQDDGQFEAARSDGETSPPGRALTINSLDERIRLERTLQLAWGTNKTVNRGHAGTL